MRLSYFAVSAVTLAILLGSLEARAFTMEPVGGNDSGASNRFTDPDERYDKLADPNASERSLSPTERNRPTFTFGMTRPESSNRPSVNRPGVDNEHLYWNNTSNRHVPYDRNSTRRRYW
jgi:hypothetical protein